MIGPASSDPNSRTRARAIAHVYVVVFVGFLGYSLRFAVFTPMILDNDNGMLPATSSAATRSIVLGLLLCLYPLGQFVGAPVLGAVSDRVGRRPTGQVMGNTQSLRVGAEAIAGVVGGLAAAAFIELPFVVFGAAALLGAGRLRRTGLVRSAGTGHPTAVVSGPASTA